MEIGLPWKWKRDSLKSLSIRLRTSRRRRGRKELYAQVNFINPVGSGDRAGARGSSRRAFRTSLEESCETEGERESESEGSNTGERAPSGAPDGLHYPCVCALNCFAVSPEQWSFTSELSYTTPPLYINIKPSYIIKAGRAHVIFSDWDKLTTIDIYVFITAIEQYEGEAWRDIGLPEAEREI